MVTTTFPGFSLSNEEQVIIKSQFWDLPEESLDDWRPYSACLHHSLLDGPVIKGGHGLDLAKNMVGFFHGPRGGTKTLSMSYSFAKILRMGKPVWTNYPISFFVIETDDRIGKPPPLRYIPTGPCSWRSPNGAFSYYESMPLNMDKWYKFSTEIRNGGVGIDELQYFAEARTSGRKQNRIGSYQIMQIRKTANTFLYTVQDPAWVDKRFGWSADFSCECFDVSRKNYDRHALGRELQEGEISRWIIHDLSGILTGEQYKKTGRDIGPFEFDGFHFFNTYPTHFIIDVYEAINSLKMEKEDKDAPKIKAIEDILNNYLAEGKTVMNSKEMLEDINGQLPEPVSNLVLGKYIASLGIEKRQKGLNKFVYDFSNIVEVKQ